MQDTDNGNPVAGRSKVDDVLLDATSSIAGPDDGAALCLLRRFGQIGTRGLDTVDVAQRLGQIPLCHGVVEYRIKVALRARAEPVFSHAARLCAA